MIADDEEFRLMRLEKAVARLIADLFGNPSGIDPEDEPGELLSPYAFNFSGEGGAQHQAASNTAG